MPSRRARRRRQALTSDTDLGTATGERIAEIDTEVAELKREARGLETEWETEQKLVAEIRSLREILAEPKEGEPPKTNGGASPEETRKQIREKFDTLEARDPEKRMIYAHVDEQAVASVVSDWTGIPVGRMVKDEVETILNSRRHPQPPRGRPVARPADDRQAHRDQPREARQPEQADRRVHARGPSGVGKTETALALAEALYGGEQNMITINMSEFQEAHTVSTLKGAPPGYVGYGEGGRLTEAVRRKPYSVILLDEVEKAHPDVHEIFFQVFDKGMMEDGTGRRIDFKNTLIILTTNVGTDLIMGLARDPLYRDDPQALAEQLRPELLKVFPAALLGRIVTIPYFPLSDEMLARHRPPAARPHRQAHRGEPRRATSSTATTWSSTSFRCATTRTPAGA